MKTLSSVLALAFVLGACQSTTPVAFSPQESPKEIQNVLTATATSAPGAASMLKADKPLLLVFWQSWCTSCVAEAPQVQAWQRTHGDRLAIAGVVSGPDESVDEGHLHQAITRLGLTYPQIRDRDLALTRLFQVSATPDIVIMNRDRKVVYRGHELPVSIKPYLQTETR